MMKDLVRSFKPEEISNIHNMTFLEPCVGTGNFVFSYLVVCKELGLSTDQYFSLINNIYVCDINIILWKVNIPLINLQNKCNINKNPENFLGDLLNNIYLSLVAKSCPTLVTPWTVTCQAPLSMGFSRQETGVGYHFLLQGIFLAQGSNLYFFCLLHWAGTSTTWNTT